MTNQSTTTKEALEPCPLAHPIVNGVRFTNFSNNVKAHVWCYDCGLEFEGRVNEPRDKVAERWNSRVSAPIVAPEVDEMGSDTNFPLSETLRLLVEWAQHLHVSHECDCDGWEQRSFLIEAAQRYRREIAERAAPAATVAPQQSVADYLNEDRCMFCGGKTEHKPDCDHGVAAPASPAAPISSEAWTEWFNRLGAKASAEVVNATADLVTNERLAALVQAKVLPDPAALRDEAHGFAGISKSVPCKKCGLIYSALVHHAATTPPSTLAKAAAEEIHKLCDKLAPDIPNDSTSYAPTVEQIAAIIERCLAGGGESGQSDAS